MADVKLEETQAQVETLKRKLLLREVEDVTRAFLSGTSLPKAGIDRILGDTVVDIPVTESGELDRVKLQENLKARVKAETAYIAEVMNPVRGMGYKPDDPDETKKAREALREAYLNNFMQSHSREEAEHLADIAVNGR